MSKRQLHTSLLTRLGLGTAAAGGAAAAYMVFEAQWVKCRQADLAVPGLPEAWSGVTILHLSDIHGGAFRTNERSLAKVMQWAEPLQPDLVFLTGDNLGDPDRSERALWLLTGLEPPLGMFAVTGNHEYGLSKGPLARPRDTATLWAEAGITLLADSCAALPARGGTRLVICGADQLTGGYGLRLAMHTSDGKSASPAASEGMPALWPGGSVAGDGLSLATDGQFPILLIHEPPPAESPLAGQFPLVFAGHTHGGQLRVPARHGLTLLSREQHDYLSGVYKWGTGFGGAGGLLVVSRGVGTSFLPFRLFTRPEATLWRLRPARSGPSSGRAVEA
jgi:uncharacterized protein